MQTIMSTRLSIEGAQRAGSGCPGTGRGNWTRFARDRMKDWTPLRARYLQDELPVRLGGLAANLFRIRSFSQHDSRLAAVESLIAESKWFIEWTAWEMGTATAAELIALQIQLAVWHLKLPGIWADLERRAALAAEAEVWSARVLEISGLLGEG